MHATKNLKAVWISSLLLLLQACTTTDDKEDLLPQDGPTMSEVYHGQFGSQSTEATEEARDSVKVRRITSGNADLRGYVRNSANEIDNLFTRLPNPTLVMFVFPHLSGEGHYPVPGYSTAFPMYEKVEYALPGEVFTQPTGPAMATKSGQQ